MIQLPQASSIAGLVDRLYGAIYWFSWLSFIAIVGAMLYFVLKYPRKKVDPNKTPYITGHHPTELAISIGLLIVVMAIFAWGWIDYVKILKAPSNALEINVIGKQWMWEFEYANGRKMLNEFVVPQGKPVKLVMTSSDVLHSFYIPNFRLKQDVVPNRYTTLWFDANQTGDHQVFCAEYCGTAHSNMLASLKVMEAKEYDRWQALWEVSQKLGIAEAQASSDYQKETPSLSPAERGQKLFGEKGCIACHSTTGQKIVGPPINGIFGHESELADGKKVKIDENYLRESLMEPQAKLVKGFPPLMPTFKGTLSDEEVNALVGYIKSLK